MKKKMINQDMPIGKLVRIKEGKDALEKVKTLLITICNYLS